MKSLITLTVTVGATVIGFALGLLFTSGKRDIHTDYVDENFNDIFDTVSHSLNNIETKIAQLSKQGKAEAKKKAADLNSKKH
ncbi:MAG: hypothetical protein JJU13_08655 [Balneolaceae bacterium]|nr:hypothetical protein [Balneolaceae bacterium]